MTNSATVFDLSAIFGGKPWYKSMTAIGLGLYAVVSGLVSQLCAPGIDVVGPELCGNLSTAASWLGQILIVLGLRRAATSANVP